MTVLDEIIAGVLEDTARREAEVPLSEIKAADYAPLADLGGVRQKLISRLESRVKGDKDYQYLLEDVAEFERQRKSEQISLNEAQRRSERDAQEAKLKARKEAGSSPDDIAAISDDGLLADERNIANDLAFEKVRKEAKDVLLNQAVRVLSDEVDLLDTASILGKGSGKNGKPLAQTTSE